MKAAAASAVLALLVTLSPAPAVASNPAVRVSSPDGRLTLAVGTAPSATP
jgi:hypothetical protein